VNWIDLTAITVEWDVNVKEYSGSIKGLQTFTVSEGFFSVE